MCGRAARLALWTGVLLIAARSSFAQQVLYGGNQWLQVESVNTGWLVNVDPETGATTPIGKPAGVARLSGLAFDAAGTLWASTISAGASGTLRTSTLITLDPADGSLLSTIGPVRDGAGGPPMGIESLAIQPGTDALFGTRGISDQNFVHAADVYRIDKATGVATLFIDNNNGFQEASITFAPDGSLYQTVSTCCVVFGGNPRLQILDPSTGAVQTTWPVPKAFKALAVRTDGALFGAAPQAIQQTDVSELYRIDPATGAVELIGETAHNPIGSLAFGPPASAGPCVSGPHTLCLNGQRFSVSARWRKADGSTGEGTAVPLTSDSGYFWFFNPANIEIVVKVLNGCFGAAPAYWVFAAGLTNVEVTLSANDTQTGSRKSYVSPLGTAFAPIQDTSAFATCP